MARFATPIYNDGLQRFDSNVRRRVEAPVQLKSPPRFLTVLDLPEYEFGFASVNEASNIEILSIPTRILRAVLLTSGGSLFKK